ncbi:hypothetical protein [Micromonospora tulbaghiae]|uniref:hypothetical protein n=1 Tax=Micromonospora tulbaghiae TaxID=479978 RepID=UPI00342E8035
MPGLDQSDDEYRERSHQHDLAEECLATLRGFMRSAENPLYHQEPIPNAVKEQLLGGLTDVVPVMGVLSARSSLSLMDLLSRLKGAPVEGLNDVRALADLSINRDNITYAELYPLVTGVIDPLKLALDRFRRQYLTARKTGRPMLTVRVDDVLQEQSPRTYDVGEGTATPQS